MALQPRKPSLNDRLIVFGNGPRKVLVFSALHLAPIDREFCRAWFAPFADSHTLFIADPLASGLQGGWDECVRDWSEALEGSSFAEAWGFSLGGCLLQKLSLSDSLASARLVFVSTCSRAEAILLGRLDPILNALRAGDLETAFELKSRLILENGQRFEIPNEGREPALRRLEHGYRLVATHDAQAELRARDCAGLFVLGGRSRLMNRETLGEIFHHQIRIADDCGMRVAIDDPKSFLSFVNEAFV